MTEAIIWIVVLLLAGGSLLILLNWLANSTPATRGDERRGRGDRERGANRLPRRRAGLRSNHLFRYEDGH
jgi:hypothetical protein